LKKLFDFGRKIFL